MNYNKTVLFNPAVSSLNLGDHIIGLGAKKQISNIIEDHFIVEVSTHLPVSRMYMRHLKDSNLKFVLGSNLLRGKMNHLFRQWDIRMDQSDLIKNSILVGVGWWQYNDDPNLYTKQLYKNILSKNYIHSVRDEYTKEQLHSIGITNVLNTSCATMWDLTEEHCSNIKLEKQKNVVFTLTDYNKNKVLDKKMIQILLKNYNNVYFWIQGTGDYNYIKTLNVDLSRIKMIPPSVEAYDKVLEQDDLDYIGTRLHAGVRALQFSKRTVIIGIDNRAKEKQKDFNLCVLSRENMDGLENLINNEIPTEIVIPTRAIKEWRDQFQ